MVDGIIMISGNDDLASSNYFKGKPIVFIDRGIQDEENISIVGSNHYQGGKLAAQKLFDNKCKNIAFITQDKNLQINKEIFRGANELLTKQEIPLDNNIIVSAMPDDKFSKTGATTSTVTELIHKGRFNYDGAICTDDRVAVGAILALEKCGKVIPEDFKIIGYGNDPISKYFTPALTSIRQDYALLAKESVKELFYRIEEEVERVAHAITIPVSLVNRQTTI
ncbi:substrate-binding domain-containing protein [Tetragenococcus halophilus]|nr:substrate-binding domain-containing protein [Tetragenococcus halophilus]